MIKRQFGYAKVRYRGLAKNTAQVLTLFALSNLWLTRKELMHAAGRCACNPGNIPKNAPKAEKNQWFERPQRGGCGLLRFPAPLIRPSLDKASRITALL